MKKDIHPKFNLATKATCSCGAAYTVASTLDSFTVEICSSCHPYYTGNEKVIDAAGRVDRFKKRAAAGKATAKAKK